MSRTEIIAAIVAEATNSNCPAETAARVLGIDEDTWEDVADEVEEALACEVTGDRADGSDLTITTESMDYSLTAGACHDANLTAARALELAINAIVDDHETATVTGPDGDCTIVSDADDCTVRLVSPTGEILAIRDADPEDLDCFEAA